MFDFPVGVRQRNNSAPRPSGKWRDIALQPLPRGGQRGQSIVLVLCPAVLIVMSCSRRNRLPGDGGSIAGIAVCCAHASRKPVNAMPPRRVMNSLRVSQPPILHHATRISDLARGAQAIAAPQRARGTEVSNGSWLCENADVLRRRRMAFSSIGCSFLLARGFVSWRPPMQRRRNLENSAVPTLLARGSRLAFYATMWRAVSDLEARWNRILTIFDPYTFSHSQGHELSIHHPGQNSNLATALPPAGDQPSDSSPNDAV